MIFLEPISEGLALAPLLRHHMRRRTPLTRFVGMRTIEGLAFAEQRAELIVASVIKLALAVLFLSHSDSFASASRSLLEMMAQKFSRSSSSSTWARTDWPLVSCWSARISLGLSET